MIDFDKMFPDEREKGETNLRQCQLVMLRMLKVFDYLCLKYDIKYFMTGGSLIGAIRHQGFIPWDDDLDVGMTRANYEKFLKYAVKDLPNDIFFQNPQTDPFYSANSNVDARLRDKYSSYANNDPRKKFHLGLQLDIFVYDRAYLPHNFFVITSNKILAHCKDNLQRARILKVISKWIPLPKVYGSNYQQFYGAMKQGTYITPKEYKTLLRSKFEDMEVYIPAGFDTYLKRQYGDYMELPPIEKRSGGHGGDVANPFLACNHREILHWDTRKSSVQFNMEIENKQL